jgi:hypothetical protein
MRFTIAAAAVVALVATVPAFADHNGGGMTKQNGQCWKSAKTMDGGTFGSWSACSGGAATPAPAAAHRRAHS